MAIRPAPLLSWPWLSGARRAAAPPLPRRPCLAATLLLLACAWGLRAPGCSTPVFQFALENWPADPYDLLLTFNGLEAAALRQQADAVLSADGVPVANLELRLLEDPALPTGTASLALNLPNRPAATPPVWRAAWSVDHLRTVIASPARARLTEELLHRATAVFLFLPSGDARVDAPARTRLQEALDELSRTLALPEPADAAPPAPDAPTPTAIRFALLDLSPQDPAEAVLRAVLLASEPDLASLHQPMTFPVFGRGRVLYAIVGAGINRDVLSETCAFLTGACSCEVKAQNPGVDLLLQADWDRALGFDTASFLELPPLSGLSAAGAEPATAAAGPLPSAPSPPAASARPGYRGWTLAAAALALLIVLGGTVAVLLSSRSR